jgi:hypothetical protein
VGWRGRDAGSQTGSGGQSGSEAVRRRCCNSGTRAVTLGLGQRDSLSGLVKQRGSVAVGQLGGVH